MDAAVTPILKVLDQELAGATLVRVLSLRGFGLRDTGDGAVVLSGEHGSTLAGSVVGGVSDEEVRRNVASSTARRATTLTVTDDAADVGGMLCGGTAQLLMTPVDDLLVETGQLLRQATPMALIAASDGNGSDLVITARDTFGSLGPDLDNASGQLVAEARRAIADGASTTTAHDVGATTFLISTIVPATSFLIVGIGSMADAIAAQGDLMGWSTEISTSVGQAKSFAERSGPADGLAVLSHDSSLDVPILSAALSSGMGYIGGMGSRATQARRQNGLKDLGHSDSEIGRIHGPIGLDLGSRCPSETAVAVVAEFLANRSGRSPGSLRAGAGPING